MTVYDDDPLLGEVPDVPARSGVAAVLAAADKMSAAVQAIAEIRELHTPSQPKDPKWRYCTECGLDYDWPCPTITILERWGLR